ncbi:MAG: tRNA (5-methylaminomethyl-2-thiouridine)(34)-methyltransferase MnmD [Maricaulaceae bacterium]|nr:tRNA (5-methylaminomethyl-2-thiouridine)(34)-methyltransferase MnmD [Maricaulaceae bacterium]
MTLKLYCEPPALDWDGPVPRAAGHGDVYFSAEGGLDEARAVFLSGCGLPGAWRGRRSFTVGELGFGTGLNILALLDLWRREGPPGAWLHVVSVEASPLTRDQARRAHAAWPELAELSAALLAQWPAPLRGAHRLRIDDLRATLTLHFGAAAEALPEMDFRAGAWFLDGFAPAKNPEMWDPALFGHVARLSAPGARAATFTVAGAVRRGLAAAGFAVDKRPGFGRKRERLEAVYRPGEDKEGVIEGVKGGLGGSENDTVAGALDTPLPVIGGGVAGAALAGALRARGLEAYIIDPAGLSGGASGAPAGLLTPRLELADRPHVRALLAAFEYARRLYDGRDGFHASGAARLPRDAKEAERLQALAAAMGDGYDWNGTALSMDRAGWFEPRKLVAALAAETPVIHARAADISPNGEGGWRVLDEDGRTLADSPVLLAAPGAGAARWFADIAPSAGRVAGFAGAGPETPIVWGGYACPAPGGALAGATHEKGADPGDADAARAKIFNDLRERLPALAEGLTPDPARDWSGVRAVTPDRLPVCGELSEKPGVFLLSGLGSRGFAHAPLLAETLVSQLFGEPCPLEISGFSAFAPGRFAARRARRAQTPSKAG